MCALLEPTGDVIRELFYHYDLLWSFFVFFSESNFPKNIIIIIIIIIIIKNFPVAIFFGRE